MEATHDNTSVGSPAESTELHTQALKVSLQIEESQAFWASWTPDKTVPELSAEAFEARWFGHKSMARVQILMRTFNRRFMAFPTALSLLHRWQPTDATTRANICHWHAQLSDPLYRSFTMDLLARRLQSPNPGIDRDVVLRWLQREHEGRWSVATTVRMASGMLSTATQAGLCSEGTGTHSLHHPKVTDEALAYILYLLREIRFEGTLLDNPYLRSVGLASDQLHYRLRRLKGLDFQQSHGVTDMGWNHPDLRTWGEHCLMLQGGPG